MNKHAKHACKTIFETFHSEPTAATKLTLKSYALLPAALHARDQVGLALAVVVLGNDGAAAT